MDAYIGQIMYGCWSFAPRGWMFCNGQIIAIAQNQALFALLGTNFGGNGSTTFGLPDLRGRVPLHFGQGPGLQNYILGQVGGVETQVMSSAQMPMHTHGATFVPTPGNLSVGISAKSGVDPINEESAPSANCFLGTAESALYVPAATTGGTMVALGGVSVTGGSGGTVQNAMAGGSQPVPTMQPYLTITAVICTSGLYPSRN